MLEVLREAARIGRHQCLARCAAKHDWLAAVEVTSLGQITHERRGDVRRRLKFELLERLRLRQVPFVQTPRNDVVFALLELRGQ